MDVIADDLAEGDDVGQVELVDHVGHVAAEGLNVADEVEVEIAEGASLSYKTFKNYLQTVGFNAEPVLLTYPDNTTISDIIKETQKAHAEFEFTMTYRDTHYLWKIEDEPTIKIIQKEFTKKKL